MNLIVGEVRQMLIVLSKMSVVGHKFGVRGKCNSIQVNVHTAPPKSRHFSQKKLVTFWSQGCQLTVHVVQTVLWL